jgi:hypothetical protein
VRLKEEVKYRQDIGDIVHFGKLLHERGYFAATDGNLSVRLDCQSILINLLNGTSPRLREMVWNWRDDTAGCDTPFTAALCLTSGALITASVIEDDDCASRIVLGRIITREIERSVLHFRKASRNANIMAAMPEFQL